MATAYQYLVEDGFVFRRPMPPEFPSDVAEMQIWDGKAWSKPINIDVALSPMYYGMEITEADAIAKIGPWEGVDLSDLNTRMNVIAAIRRVRSVDLYGTSEGIIKGWETRRAGGKGGEDDKGHDSDRKDDDTDSVPRGVEPVTREDLGTTRPIPIQTKDLGEAVGLILKGEVVELQDTAAVHTVLKDLAKAAKEGKASFDLCKVSVAGTNLFCGSPLTTEEFPKGIPRVAMPQLSGKTVPGSRADALPKSKDGNVDAAKDFIKHLEDRGIPVTREKVPAAVLRATQADMKGAQVAGMMTDPTYHPDAEPIFVSSDNYVLDGHHRWAAVVGRDAEDGKLGDSAMNVIRVDAPMSELLRRAKTWTEEFGIAAKEGEIAAPPKTALRAIFDGSINASYRERLARIAKGLP